jgi:hypothetical protein
MDNKLAFEFNDLCFYCSAHIKTVISPSLWDVITAEFNYPLADELMPVSVKIRNQIENTIDLSV